MARCAILGLQAAGGRPVFVGGWGNDAAPSGTSKTAMVGSTPSIISLTKRKGPLASTSHFYVNGLKIDDLAGSAAVPDFGRRDDLGFFMGNARSWLRGFIGDVAEVALYNRALTDQERAGVETHLSAKFRIPLPGAEHEQVVAHGDPAFRKRHWAFEPISDPVLSVDESHPVDQFVSAMWNSRGLRPVAAADPRTLVRRLYFDLTGLPPAPAEMKSAVAALTPWSDAAWAALIDQLLASPRYGERWGRHWLDVARYADTAGDNADYPIPEARLYRDYVIDAFNDDMPYDQFVREQIAGDILAGESPQDRYAEQVTATGFLALSRRYATGPYELWHLSLEDTIDTVGQAFLGLSLRCARCHDHKFDPVSQHDYYALYGIFESTQYPWAGAEEFHSQKKPRMNFAPLLPPAEAEPLRRAYEIAMQTADDSNSDLKAQLQTSLRRGYPLEIPGAYAVQEGTPRPTVIQQSGDPGKPGAVVARGVPEFLEQSPPRTIPSDQSGRRQLAEWLTDPDHPLTARVMVNRIWHHHFGRGLVATPSNFGSRGSAPTHPDLLDWLARRFIESGWSVKAIHRLILTSRVWRLSSENSSECQAVDPKNQYLWRHERRRLDAEAIRDSLLAISGRLDLGRPGPHAFPPISEWQYTQHNQFRDFYPSTHRSVYLMTTRLQRHPFLAMFDGPDTNTSTDRRTSSIVPSQALYLMNSEEVKTVAESFARRVMEAAPESRVAHAFSLAFQREPASEEVDSAETFIAEYSARSDEAAAWTVYCRSLLISHETFYLD